MNFLGFNPMKALVWSGIVQGFSTPPLMLLILLMTNNRAVMGERVNGWGHQPPGRPHHRSDLGGLALPAVDVDPPRPLSTRGKPPSSPPSAPVRAWRPVPAPAGSVIGWPACAEA